MQSVSSNAVASALGGYTKIKMSGNSSFTNANDLPDGFYCVYNIANAPTNHWFCILTLTFDGNPDYKIQMAFQIANQSIYTRYSAGVGNWSGWRTI